MSKVTVYQFTIYEIANDASRKSFRWATREAIKWAGGHVLEDTAIEVDASDVGAEIKGMTARGYDPYRVIGFQRQVKS